MLHRTQDIVPLGGQPTARDPLRRLPGIHVLRNCRRAWLAKNAGAHPEPIAILVPTDIGGAAAAGAPRYGNPRAPMPMATRIASV